MKKRNFIEKLKNDYIGQSYATFCGILIIAITLSIIVFIGIKGLKLFMENGYSVTDFLFKSDWIPKNRGSETFGALPLILGSTSVSLGAVILSAPVAISIAIFTNHIAKSIGLKVVKPALEILVGIPSVVYGWVGISVLVPYIKNNFEGMGYSLLSGILVLSLMILPTIATLSMDAIKVIPKSFIEASYGLGATRWQTIYRVVLPSAKSGIITGVVLGVARAFGEALAVQMVIGNIVKVPDGLLSPMSTITSVITMDMANTTTGSVWNNALWTLAFVLLIISFLFITIVRLIEKRRMS